MKIRVLAAALACLALVACGDPYDNVVLSSGGDSVPRLVMQGERAFTLRHGTVARVLPLVFKSSGNQDDDMRDGDLDFRSRDPNVVRVERGRDPLEFYFSGAALGSTQVDVYYRGRRVDELAATVIAPGT